MCIELFFKPKRGIKVFIFILNLYIEMKMNVIIIIIIQPIKKIK